MYDDELPHEVWVDTSDFAVGATLVQKPGDEWLPVEYMLHWLSAAELSCQ